MNRVPSPQAIAGWPRLARLLEKNKDFPYVPLSELRQRIAKIKRRREPSPPASSPPAPEAGWALDQLDEAWEELNVAAEELRVQAEQLDDARALLDSERENYRQLFNFAPEPLLATDSVGKILAANQAAVALLDTQGRGLAGRMLLAFVLSAERSTFRAHLNNVVLQGETPRWDCSLGLPPIQPVLQICVEISAGSDGRGGVLWSLRDVTERRLHEARIQSLNNELEQRVLERTRELAAALREKDELLASLKKP